MTTPTPLPLDAAALDWLHDNHAHDLLGNHPQVIYQARAALTLAARVAEQDAEALRYYAADGSFVVMESREAVVAARIEAARRMAELEAELARAKWDVAARNAHTNALRAALVKFGEHSMSCLADAVAIGPAGRATILERGGDPDAEHQPCTCGYDAALASTPAASLAAYRKSVLREASNWVRSQNTAPHFTEQLRYTIAEGIDALAAQAATHSVPGGTSEVKP